MTPPFLELVDLASERLGAEVVAANDDFFAPKESLIKSDAPVWIEGKYTDHGKWMDGWETRRRREPGHDWCIVRLAAPGRVRGVDVDTAFFKGNHPEACAIDACRLDEASTDPERAEWREILPRTVLQGDAHNVLPVEESTIATHLRLRIFPDGGVARLRVYGEVVFDWSRVAAAGEADLAAVEHGGLVVAASDMFFGSRHNLIMPGDARYMGDGWETRRRRGPGHDWTIVRLGAPGRVSRIQVDTRHFKGNAPGSCSLEGCAALEWQTADWRELLPQAPLQPDRVHEFVDAIQSIGEALYVRLNIFPDGGVARLRLFGRATTNIVKAAESAG